MISFAIQIAIGIIVLGVLVLIHEVGHFIMAKWCGIRVLSFSIGFGKPLIRKTIGSTEYRLSSIPVGGYVHMAGEHPDDEHEQAPDEFTAKPVWQRALVAIAGPAANYVSAFVLLWLVFVCGVQHEIFLDRPVIGEVADSSAARDIGLAAGDSIVSINGSAIGSWEDVEERFRFQESPYRITVSRGGVEQSVVLEAASQGELGIPDKPTGGLLPPLPAIIGAIRPGSAADGADLKPGDIVRSIDSIAIQSWYHLSSLIAEYDTAQGTLALRVQRGTTLFTVNLTPTYSEEHERYLLGLTVGTPPSRLVRYGPPAALARAMEKTGEYTTMIFTVLAKLLTQKVSPNQLAGPIGIMQMSGVAALGGLTAVLNFMALIGINLAVLNLFPLIITDGGVLLFLALEALRGRPLSLKHQLLINRIAIALFIALFLFVTLNDIKRFPLLFRLFSR